MVVVGSVIVTDDTFAIGAAVIILSPKTVTVAVLFLIATVIAICVRVPPVDVRHEKEREEGGRRRERGLFVFLLILGEVERSGGNERIEWWRERNGG